MKNEHLTEKELQEFVMDDSAVAANIAAHATTCADCQQKIADYKLLFAAIKQQPRPSFGFDLTGLVMPQLPPVQKPVPADNLLTYIFITISIIIAGLGLYFFGNPLLSLFDTTTPLAIYLALTTALVLAVVLCIDLLKNHREKIHQLDLY